jgi:hypothetical protein
MIDSNAIGRPWKSAPAARCVHTRGPKLRFVLSFLLTATVIPGGLYRGTTVAGQRLIVTNNEAIDDDSNANVANAPPAAWGQDDWDAAKKAANKPARQGVFALPDFDSWVLRGQTESTLKSMLALQIESVARCELSAAQREKLQMAGEGDLKRLARTIGELREKFREAGQDQQKYNELIQEGSAMQMKLQSGIYGESSLFQKVLRQTLNHEQSVRFEQQERERRKFRYEAKIELVMANLEGTISLTAEQRQRLVKLLVDETEPPKKFGQYDNYMVFVQAGRLEEAKFKPILDDSQRRSFKKLLDQYRGMDQFLRQQGYLP